MAARLSITRRHLIAGTLALPFIPIARAVASAGCVAPITNILGPAYRKGSPFRARLCPPDEPGTPLTMQGRIVDAESCKPLTGTVLDIWQVNQAGDYDMDSTAFRLRGKIKADAAGRYAFDTIMPVPYGPRPKHIHYLITRDGYEPRITQVYFEGDDRNTTDPYVKKELIIATAAHAGDPRPGARLGALDVALERDRPAEADAEHTYREYVGRYQYTSDVTLEVTTDGRKLYWHANVKDESDTDAADGEFQPRAKGRFFVPEYDFEVTFVRNEHGVVDHTLNSDGHLSKKIE
jgi:protocatechuate 3,4-dioxygenase beta subunit